MDAARLMQAVESWIENEVARLGDPRGGRNVE
jgi:hypothetical protein